MNDDDDDEQQKRIVGFDQGKFLLLLLFNILGKFFEEKKQFLVERKIFLNTGKREKKIQKFLGNQILLTRSFVFFVPLNIMVEIIPRPLNKFFGRSFGNLQCSFTVFDKNRSIVGSIIIECVYL